MADTRKDNRFSRWAITVPLSLDENGESDGEGRIWSPPDQRDAPEIRYLVAGLEVCPDTGRLHWQVYIEVFEKRSLKNLKAIIGCPWAHLEKAYASGEKNRAYCAKDYLDFVEWGCTAIKAGWRTDLQPMIDAIKEGKDEWHMAQHHTGSYIKYHGGADKAIALHRAHGPARGTRAVRVEVHWGVPGSGKTHGAFELDPELYMKPLGMKDIGWWDGYCGQKTLLLDDFTGQIEINELKRILDKYPYSVSVRGRAPVQAEWETVRMATVDNFDYAVIYTRCAGLDYI